MVFNIFIYFKISLNDLILEIIISDIFIIYSKESENSFI